MLKEKSVIDNQIMRVMKINSISHLVANTDRGTLTLTLAKNGSENDYRYALDAVPYDDKTNKELLELFHGN